MRLDEALSDMQAIRSQLNRVQVATCYRSATAAASGSLALGAAAIEYLSPQIGYLQLLSLRAVGSSVVSEKAVQFLSYWSFVAFLCVFVIAVEMGWRYWKVSAPHQRRHTRQSLAEFLPSIAVGLVLGLLVVFQQPEHAALLPGLWSILFGLGILATLKRLPTGSIWIVVHYLVAGFFCLKFGAGQQALAPWTMAVTFGLGQLLAAVILQRAQPSVTSTMIGSSLENR